MIFNIETALYVEYKEITSLVKKVNWITSLPDKFLTQVKKLFHFDISLYENKKILSLKHIKVERTRPDLHRSICLAEGNLVLTSGLEKQKKQTA